MKQGNDLLAIALIIAAIIGFGFFISGEDEVAPEPAPVPTPAPVPPPEPKPKPCPGPRPCPRPAGDAGCGPVGSCCCPDCPTKHGRCCDCGCVLYETGAVVDGEEHDGVSIDCPLPPDFHTKNVGGSDRAGLCVFCSMKHSGYWCLEPVFMGLFDYMKNFPGGGYPEKVTKMVEQYAREKGLPVPDYIQVTGMDLEVLKAACRSGRMPGVTYSHSPTGRYNGSRISHMVSLVHADDNYFVILDNNYVTGDKHLEWLSPEEFKKVYSPGWAVIPLKPGPPYAPWN